MNKIQKEIEDEQDKETFKDKPEDERMKFLSAEKAKLRGKLEEGREKRMKNLKEQTKESLSRYVRTPNLFVGKNYMHKSVDETDSEPCWYTGNILAMDSDET